MPDVFRCSARVEEAYGKYISYLPLDLAKASPEQIDYWIKNNRFSKIDFCREIAFLQSSRNLDDFVRKSSGDFDNLANIVEIAIKQNFIKISNAGKIQRTYNYKFKKEKKDDLSGFTLLPKSEFNQFPCDDKSRIARYSFLKSRYPFAEYLKFAIIGEDDFLSTAFANESWAYPVIIEKDPRIIKILRKLVKKSEIIEKDVCDFPNSDNFPEVQTFITDPPYTYNGSLAFIYAGLKMLKRNQDIKEFCVVLNPTMMGKNIFAISKTLAASNVCLVETINNFSQYRLPDNFKERKRADNFLRDNALGGDILHYSSSSSLYIFRTIMPNLNNLRKKIDYKKIYTHYL